jgi:hypothetical protein
MAASSISERVGIEMAQPTRHYQIEKWYYDYAENIEAVNIHYACTPLGEMPDWNNQRATRFLPLVESHLRRKALKLPLRLLDARHGELTDCYLLHHYFEIFADGDTRYSSLYTEEVITGAGSQPVSPETLASAASEADPGPRGAALAEGQGIAESAQIARTVRTQTKVMSSD